MLLNKTVQTDKRLTNITQHVAFINALEQELQQYLPDIFVDELHVADYNHYQKCLSLYTYNQNLASRARYMLNELNTECQKIKLLTRLDSVAVLLLIDPDAKITTHIKLEKNTELDEKIQKNLDGIQDDCLKKTLLAFAKISQKII